MRFIKVLLPGQLKLIATARFMALRTHPLVRSILILSAAMTLVSAAAVGASCGPSPLTELTRCAESPCWRGISPGETRWTDAVAILANGGGGERALSSRIVPFPSDDGQVVGSLLLDRPALQLGEIIALYGRPQCIDIFRRAANVTLHYPRLHVLTHFVHDHLDPSTPVIALVLGNPTTSEPDKVLCAVSRFVESDPPVSRRQWQGFTSLQQYLSSAS